MTTETNQPSSIFELAPAQLSSVLETVLDETVASFTYRATPKTNGPYGLRGDKLTVDFSCVLDSGRTKTLRIFVKRSSEENAREALNYGQLAKHGAPIPRLYASVRAPDGKQVLFLEHIDALTVWSAEEETRFRKDSVAFPALIQSIARLNAIKLEPGSLPTLGEWETKLSEAQEVLPAIWRLACDGALGGPLRDFCLESGRKLGMLSGLCEQLARHVSQVPLGLNHGDLLIYHAGWSKTAQELLLFDLEGVSLAPRFLDISFFLGAPDHVESRCSPRAELARFYLSEYAGHGGDAVALGDFLEETRILWLAWRMRWLGLSLEFVTRGYADMPEAQREQDIRDEREKLLSLLEEAVRG